jgi:hypothetical protein
MEERILVDVHGLTITPTYLKSLTQSYQWRHLTFAGIEKGGKLRPKFALMLSTRTSRRPFRFFETRDPELAKKIEAAIKIGARSWERKKER